MDIKNVIIVLLPVNPFHTISNPSDPGLSKAFQIPTYKVTEKSNYCRHWASPPLSDSKAEPTPERKSWFFNTTPTPDPTPNKPDYKSDKEGLWVYLFPNTGINCYEPAWYSMRVLPISKTRTKLSYEIFKKKDLSEPAIQEFITFLKQVEKEDYDLCVACQKNLNAGVYLAGALQPDKENGTLYYQSLVRNMVMKHLALEKEAGEKINPAYAGLRSARRAGKGEGDSIAQVLEMEMVCNGLDKGCSSGSDEELW